jgi:predicted oxidoreductase
MDPDVTGAVTVDVPADIAPAAWVQLSPRFSAGEVQWHCRAKGVKAGHLAGYCRDDGSDLRATPMPPPSKAGCPP